MGNEYTLKLEATRPTIEAPEGLNIDALNADTQVARYCGVRLYYHDSEEEHRIE
jgi:hypothetical protein